MAGESREEQHGALWSLICHNPGERFLAFEISSSNEATTYVGEGVCEIPRSTDIKYTGSCMGKWQMRAFQLSFLHQWNISLLT